jgi:hypothetical protein
MTHPTFHPTEHAAMVTTRGWSTTTEYDTAVGSLTPSADDVVELPILLPEWQVTALEEAARLRGMTVGQLVRKLFSDLFPRRPVAV